MESKRIRKKISNIALLFGTLLCCFLVIEIGYYRFIDPFPYFSQSEINHTEHGNLSEYDESLGWKGVPGGQARFVTPNNSVWLEHNRHGFRDIEHDSDRDDRPAIVFLGDSFTWGYEVKFDEMFVNRLRDLLPEYAVFNLSHRGYGTDQALLTFRNWRSNGPIQWVVLMFSENDIGDNDTDFSSAKHKPRYQRVQNRLVLTGVPVPRVDMWTDSVRDEKKVVSWKTKGMDLLLQSHFIHDIHFRYTTMQRWKKIKRRKKKQIQVKKPDPALTSLILRELKVDVEMINAKLLVFFIPSKIEIEQLSSSPPYQAIIAEMCQELGIECFDLAPHLKRTWYRTYYREGMHWNARGHQVATEAIFEYLNNMKMFNVFPTTGDQ